MNVFDLLNKIANGEEVPKKIKHQYYDYEWNTIDKDYQRRDGEMLLGNMNIQYHLNDEIILIEDEIDIDKIEELDKCKFGHGNTISYQESKFIDKVNELIQAVKQINKEVKELSKRS